MDEIQTLTDLLARTSKIRRERNEFDLDSGLACLFFVCLFSFVEKEVSPDTILLVHICKICCFPFILAPNLVLRDEESKDYLPQW